MIRINEPEKVFIPTKQSTTEPFVALKDGVVSFDDSKPHVSVNGKNCPLPLHKNEHYLCRVMFEYLVGELGFKPPIRQGKSLVFRAKLSTFLMWSITKFSVRIDGNSVVVSGQALFVKKLTRLLVAHAGKTP